MLKGRLRKTYHLMLGNWIFRAKDCVVHTTCIIYNNTREGFLHEDYVKTVAIAMTIRSLPIKLVDWNV